MPHHDSLEVERDKSLLNRAYGVQTDVLTSEEIARTDPLVDLTGGGEFPMSGRRSIRRGPSRDTTRSCGGTRRRRNVTASTSTNRHR